MGLLGDVLWLVGYLMLLALVYRAWHGDLIHKYPRFYLYLTCVLLSSLVRSYLRHFVPDSYKIGYWTSEVITQTIGFGVTWEIYKQAFFAYSGVRRFARIVLWGFLAMMFTRATLQLIAYPVHTFVPTTLELVRNLQVVQVVVLIVLRLLVLQYGVPLGSNTMAMLMGYGFYVATSVITRTIQSLSVFPDNPWWAFPTQVAYCVTLLVWCIGMWLYVPNPAPDMALERDYQRASQQTIRAFGRLREHMIHSWRS